MDIYMPMSTSVRHNRITQTLAGRLLHEIENNTPSRLKVSLRETRILRIRKA
jgi:hypothetical protein